MTQSKTFCASASNDSTHPRGRRHSAALREIVLKACSQPDAVIRAVAQAHGVSISTVYEWRQQHMRNQQLCSPQALTLKSDALKGDTFKSNAFKQPASFVAARVEQPTPECVQVHHAASGLNLSWPLSRTNELAQFMRAWA